MQALQKRKTYGDHLALLVAGAFCLVASLLVVTLSKATPKRTHKQLATSLSRSATNE
jgi:hypothetical protein